MTTPTRAATVATAAATAATGPRLSALLMLLSLLLALLPSPAQAWGIVGHQIVATIAQTQLHPLVREHLCDILPNNTAYDSPYPGDGGLHRHCHLAPYAGWADMIRGSYPWASRLHYVNPLHDEPPKHCTYGQDGWASDQNVLSAIVNYTSIVRDAEPGSYRRDTALRFLTHFIGDMHQPLHLTGRARGGNDVWVQFEGRRARLHSVWDSLIINSQVRSLANYTRPLPNLRIESALRGTIYDNYIRWILQEGMGQGARDAPQGWWSDESDEWPSCPDKAQQQQQKQHQEQTPSRLAGAALWLKPLAPHTSRAVRSLSALVTPKSPVAAPRPASVDDDDVDDTDLPVCPMAWSKPMHDIVCEYAFASPVPDVEEPGEFSASYLEEREAASTWPPAPELDVPEYLGRVTGHHIVERQLARGGVRLAAVLNSLLLPEAKRLAGQSIDTLDAADAGFPIHKLKSHLRTLDAPVDPIKTTRNKHSGKGRGAPILDLIKVTASSIMEVVMLSTVGYILARRGVIDKRTQTKINKLNVSCFTPALLFSKVAFTLNPARLAELSIVPLGFVIVTLTSSLVAWGLATGPRFGQTAAYLAGAQIVVFAGGEIPDGNATQTTLVSNDVLALNVSALASSVGASTNASSAWLNLTQADGPSVAYASHAVTDNALWIVGGATAKCDNAAPIYSWTKGDWTMPALSPSSEAPARRRGAQAIQVPLGMGLEGRQAVLAEAQGGVSFMVLGGAADESTCRATLDKAAAPAKASPYFGLDIWTHVNGTLSTRSMALPRDFANMSLVDYVAVRLPQNDTLGTAERVVFIGGSDVSGGVASLSSLWTMDLNTGRWSTMATRGVNGSSDVPAGRVGHVAARLADSRILVHGGYLNATASPSRSASSDAFVLDVSATPAVWTRLDASGISPARAYHSAVMVNGVLVLGFGQGMAAASDPTALGPMTNHLAGTSIAAGLNAALAANPVSFLDTSAETWSWTNSLDTVVEARSQRSAAIASAAAATVAPATATAAPTLASPSNVSPQQSAPAPEATAEVTSQPSSGATGTASQPADGSVAEPANQQESTPAPSSNDGQDSKDATTASSKLQTPKDSPAPAPKAPAASSSSGGESQSDQTTSGKSGAIAGSVLGAAALAAAVGGLYAAHKRRRAAMENEDDDESLLKSGARYSDMSDRGPPVSNLWFNQPAAWASAARRSIKRKTTPGAPRDALAALNANSDPFADSSPYTSPQAGSFQVLRNLPKRGRRSMRRPTSPLDGGMLEAQRGDASAQPLPDSFIGALIGDDEDRFALDHVSRTVGAEARARAVSAGNHLVVPPAAIARAASSESLDSDTGASHFSYPYLAGMHRPGGPDMGFSSPSSFGFSGDETETSPRAVLMRNGGAAGRFDVDRLPETWTPDAALRRNSEDTVTDIYGAPTEDAGSEYSDDASTVQTAHDVFAHKLSTPKLDAVVPTMDSPLFPWEAAAQIPTMPPRARVIGSPAVHGGATSAGPAIGSAVVVPSLRATTLRAAKRQQELIDSARVRSSRRARRSQLRVVNASAAGNSSASERE